MPHDDQAVRGERLQGVPDDAGPDALQGAQVLTCAELERSSRLGLTWFDGLWLAGCPQVKRALPTFVLAG